MAKYEFDPQSLASHGLAEAVTIRLEQLKVPRQKLVVDLGCGDNSQVRRLAEAGRHSLGVDYDCCLMSRPKLQARDRFVVADARNLPFKDGSVGVILGNNLLDYMDSEGLNRFTAEVNRSLSPDGIAIFPESLSLGRSLSKKIGLLREKLEECGFCEEEEFPGVFVK